MKINEKEYSTPTLDFESMTKLEGWGITIDKMADRPLGFLAGFVALAVGGSVEEGAKAIDDHIKGGGSLDDLVVELNKSIEASGFFNNKVKGGE